MRTLPILGLLLCGLAAAQDAPAPPAPPDVKLTLELREGLSRYHRGELVPVRLRYSCDVQGKYVKAVSPGDLKNGGEQTLHCEPADSIVPLRATGLDSLRRFLDTGPGCGFGMGFGSGGCGDCRGFYTLGPVPINFEMNLNRQAGRLGPGHYACSATAADVAPAYPTENRQALQLVSNTVSFDVVEDSVWSRAALAEALAQIQATCDDVPAPPPGAGTRWLTCNHAAEVLFFLDTDDSLRAAVHLFHGRRDGRAYWQMEMWDAIARSPNRKLAIELLSQRMSEGDFAVTEDVVQALGAWRLQQRHPDAFAPGAPEVDAAAYHDEAVEILRSLVRTLGESLPGKREEAFGESVKSYEKLAGWQLCQVGPLISEPEARATLAAAGR
ncbi:MAG TPA: hypothetical protein VEG08_16090 [Terriglobales bacterium]|nr:hypothetical protein [Terriglobales bacterium]